jgi:general stress protein 26
MADDDRIWTLMDDQGVCMMTTATPEGALRARPMHAVLERERKEVWFYTRMKDGKCEEIADDAQVCLAFSCPKSNDYVSVSGVASATQDRAMIRKHWSRFVAAWFPDGPDGADVGMIRVRVTQGEYWDGDSSSLLAALKMLAASASDETPDMGENRKVAF